MVKCSLDIVNGISKSTSPIYKQKIKIIKYINKEDLINYLGAEYNPKWFHESDTFISYSVFKNKEITELHIYYKK